MNIVSYKLSSLKLSLKKPFVTSLRRVEYIDDIVLELFTDDKLVGYGAAAPTVAITGESKVDIIETIEKIILPKILNKKLDVSLLDEVKESCEKHTSAKACVDIALHDLLAKEAKLPLYRYLGGKNKILKTCVTISLGEIDEMLVQSKNAYNDGFTQLKVKLGNDVKHSISVVKKIHEELPKAELLLDANQAWSFESAKDILQALKNIPISLVEQPLSKDEITNMKKIKNLDLFSILADESVFDTSDAKKLLETDSCDMINIKLMKCGGLGEAKKIADFANKYGKTLMLGSMLENPISIAAAAHFALSVDNIAYLDLDSPILAISNPIQYSLRYKKEIISLAEEFGLGITEI